MSKKASSKIPRTTKLLLIAGLSILSLSLVVGIITLQPGQKTYEVRSSSADTPNKCLKIDENDCRIALEVSDTNPKRLKGLSGKPSMPENEGMLFVFDSPSKECFWMKEMNFSIDMIWLDQNGQVIQVNDNVSPDTYPKNFCSPEPVKYVIELNAGQAEKLGINLNETLVF